MKPGRLRLPEPIVSDCLPTLPGQSNPAPPASLNSFQGGSDSSPHLFVKDLVEVIQGYCLPIKVHDLTCKRNLFLVLSVTNACMPNWPLSNKEYPVVRGLLVCFWLSF